MKIGFLLFGGNKEKDYSNFELFNPGIGGTQYMFLLVSYYLKKRYPDLDVYMFSENPSSMPKTLHNIKIDNLSDCLISAEKINLDYLVVRGPYITKESFNIINSHRQKIIVWSHNFETHNFEIYVSRSKNIVKNICVSSEQLDCLYDTKIFKKSCFIFNGLNFDGYNAKKAHTSKKIVYIGNLLPGSGYETLLSAWPIIKKRFPEYELIIIGGHSLYSQNVVNTYSEKTLIKIQKQESKLLNMGVVFRGVLKGKQKIEEMSSAAIGISNITPSGETFGLSIVEFEALGIPVVSLGKRGIRDTTKHNITGVLIRSNNQLARGIIKILRNYDEYFYKAQHFSHNFVNDNFNINVVVDEWYKMLLNPEKYNNVNKEIKHFFYDKKCLLAINGVLRKLFPFLPSHLFYKSIINSFKRAIAKI